MKTRSTRAGDARRVSVRMRNGDPAASVVRPRRYFDSFLAAAFGGAPGMFGQPDLSDPRSGLDPSGGPPNHRCLIHDGPAEQLPVIVPFVRDAIADGARCIYVADEHHVAGVESALRAGDIGVEAASGSGALIVTTKRETYLRTGVFDPEDTIAFLHDARLAALADGYQGLRVTSEMTWSLGSETGNDRLIEFESKVNRFLAAHEDVVVLGQYNRQRFEPSAIRDVLRTHPVVGFAGEMSPNVYYVPPDEFLDPPRIAEAVERILTNISTRQRITTGLRAAAYYSRALYDLNLDAVVTTTPDGSIRDLNGAMESLLGRRRAALLGTMFANCLSDPARAAEFFARIRLEGTVVRFEVSAVGADGLTTPVALNAFALRDNVGKVRAIVASARDLTDEKRVEGFREGALEQARALERAQTDFVSRVSHELRSPLASVLGYLELLTDEDAAPLDVEQRSMLGVMERNGRRLLNLVEDLLTMSRLGAGTLELHRECVSASSLVDHALEGFMPQIAKKQLTSEVAVDASIELIVDREAIERAIVNLVSNAVKFTDPGGHICVTCRREGEDAVISVRDTGIGVPVDEQPELFTRFFRSRLSLQRETQGTGIGLFLVHEIVEAHGGCVAVTSSPGVGTTVEVRLAITGAGRPAAVH